MSAKGAGRGDYGTKACNGIIAANAPSHPLFSPIGAKNPVTVAAVVVALLPPPPNLCKLLPMS